MTNNGNQFCTFQVDRYHFGVNVRHVQEVLRYHEMARVPLVPPVLKGLLNLRGMIVPAIDLHERLQLPSRLQHERPINIVVHTSDGPMSLLADELRDVVTASEDDFEPPPDTVTGVTARVVTGCYKLSQGLLLVLDHERVADIVEDVEHAIRSRELTRR